MLSAQVQSVLVLRIPERSARAVVDEEFYDGAVAVLELVTQTGGHHQRRYSVLVGRVNADGGLGEDGADDWSIAVPAF
jgi:hypothetical protein